MRRKRETTSRFSSDTRPSCEEYLALADRNEMAITHLFEIHRNEDYLTGSRELANLCGAGIWHGKNFNFAYGNPVKEGEIFLIGTLELGVIETPGHTEESILIVLKDREVSDKPYMVFCGDALLAGDIGRTDFYGQERKAEMAGKIHDSIVKKILALGEGVIVCPAHGAGSLCGGDIADHSFTTAGYERATNPLLALAREEFIARRVTESPYYPPYFRTMEVLNANGPQLLDRIPRPGPLSIPEVVALRKSGCQIVDIRSPTSFAAGHIPHSLSIWRDGLPSFMGWFLDYNEPIVVVDDFNCGLKDVFCHFTRLGYDNLRGYLGGGFPSWSKAAQETDSFATCTAQELKERQEKETVFVLDVRDIKNRRSVGHIPRSHHRYIGELTEHLDEIPRDLPVITYCDGGYKGSLAAGILHANRYRSVTNMLGGMTSWKNTGFWIER
ncbi:MAG: MBL fold metallo-hydrolase [Methanoregula sp. SKADARSKE-2]|nr:MAG: MBL fold metallo-hydrolase [Methanoregula sp. SKADARSKE-2]